VVDDGDDEALEAQVDGEAEVDRAVDDERVAVDGGVDVGELADCVDHGPGHEGEVGEGEPLLRLPRGLGRVADPVDVVEVDLDDGEDVGRRLLGADHVLGRPPADVGAGDDLVAVAPGGRGGGGRGPGRGCGGRGGGRRGGTGSALVEVGEDVVA